MQHLLVIYQLCRSSKLLPRSWLIALCNIFSCYLVQIRLDSPLKESCVSFIFELAVLWSLLSESCHCVQSLSMGTCRGSVLKDKERSFTKVTCFIIEIQKSYSSLQYYCDMFAHNWWYSTVHVQSGHGTLSQLLQGK